MNKQTIEINVPDGFEVDGEPREPKAGEWYMQVNSKRACLANKDLGCGLAIILRKKKPVYACIHDNYTDLDYVEIKALKDALELIDDLKTDSQDEPLIKALKEMME